MTGKGKLFDRTAVFPRWVHFVIALLGAGAAIFVRWLLEEDNGIGIPVEHRERIFGVFQRLSENYGGTGIGLAIVRKAAERMGGQVGVESELGSGSRFWIELKAAPAVVSAAAENGNGSRKESGHQPWPLNETSSLLFQKSSG